MNKLLRLLASSIFLLSCAPLFAGGQSEAPGGRSGRVVDVFVSILPQVAFVKLIGGDRVAVHALVPPGVEPETYDPTPRQLTMLSQARLYFAIGLPFETALIPKIRSAMKNVTVVDTQAGVPRRSFAQNSVGATSEGGAPDPHIWLAPELVKIQGATIERALIEADPAGSQLYRAGLVRLDNEMDRLHSEIAKTLSGLAGRSFFVFHPAFGYFAHEFGLHQVSIETEGKSPGPRELANLITEAQRLDVKAIFVEPQFDQSRAKVIADSVGAQVVTIDPLAEDYAANLVAVAQEIRTALQ